MNIKKFVAEVISEAKSLKFPKWKETYISAIAVTITVFVFALMIVFMDLISSKVILAIFKL